MWGIMKDCVRPGRHTEGGILGRLGLRRRPPQPPCGIHGESPLAAGDVGLFCRRKASISGTETALEHDFGLTRDAAAAAAAAAGPVHISCVERNAPRCATGRDMRARYQTMARSDLSAVICRLSIGIGEC